MSPSDIRPLVEHLYVCENCHRLGVISDFNDECRPGWTHGRLTRVESGTEAASNILRAAFG